MLYLVNALNSLDSASCTSGYRPFDSLPYRNVLKVAAKPYATQILHQLSVKMNCTKMNL